MKGLNHPHIVATWVTFVSGSYEGQEMGTQTGSQSLVFWIILLDSQYLWRYNTCLLRKFEYVVYIYIHTHKYVFVYIFITTSCLPSYFNMLSKFPNIKFMIPYWPLRWNWSKSFRTWLDLEGQWVTLWKAKILREMVCCLDVYLIPRIHIQML